jgi:hypothetical protein
LETTIAGFHYSVWSEGYAERKPARGKQENVLKDMSVTESIIWGIVLIPMVVMSIFLLCGKGAFLIAGYNTMSKEEQAKYDEKALCRSTGKFLLWITCCVMFLPFCIYSEDLWMTFCIVGIIMVSTIIFLIYANTGNRFHKKEDVEKSIADESEEEKALNAKKEAKRTKFQLWFLGLTVFGLLAVMLAVPGLLLFGEKEPTVTISDSGIKISGMYGIKIDFTEITDITLMQGTINAIPREFGSLQRTNGYDSGKTQKGYWSNDHARVLLFTRTNSSPTIHNKRNGKEDVFLNLSNSEGTRQLYNDMKTALARN